MREKSLENMEETTIKEKKQLFIRAKTYTFVQLQKHIIII